MPIILHFERLPGSPCALGSDAPGHAGPFHLDAWPEVFRVQGLGFRVWGLGFRVWGRHNCEEFSLRVPL